MLEEIKVIHVGKFKEAGEMAAPGFKATYAFLCDISHPTYMHSFFYWLTLDSAWTNQLWAQEMHRIWDELIKAAETAVGGICAAMIEIYDDCLPDIEKEIASSAPKL